MCACAPAIRVLIQKKALPALNDLSRSMGSWSDERSETATEMLNITRPTYTPSLKRISSVSQNTYEVPNAERPNTSVTRGPFSPEWPSSSRTIHKDRGHLPQRSLSTSPTPLSPCWPLQGPKRESSVISLDGYYDHEKDYIPQPLPKARLQARLSSVPSESEGSSLNSLLELSH